MFFKFVKNFWPLLLTGFLLFGTGIGSLITGTVSAIAGFIPTLLGLIPGLVAFLASPIGLAVLGTAAVVGGGGWLHNKMKGDEAKKEIDESQTVKLNKGGQVPGRGPNKDTVPAMLTPGEFVMSRDAVDKWGADVTVSGSQKGLMMPPGLGIVAANAKALRVHQHSTMPKLYWDWNTRLQAEDYRKFCGTAPQLMVFGMREALDMIFEEGLENIYERHRVLAGATHAAVEVWSQAGTLSLNAIEPKERSTAVTTILTDEGVDANMIRDVCRDEMMVGLGGGLGNLAGRAFRVGHMGDMNAPMLFAALASIEATFRYLDIKFAPGGVTAAIEHVAQSKKVGTGPFSY